MFSEFSFCPFGGSRGRYDEGPQFLDPWPHMADGELAMVYAHSLDLERLMREAPRE